MKSSYYIILTAICIGFVGVLVKLINLPLHFMTLNFYRLFFGFLTVAILVPFFDKKFYKVKKKDWKQYIFVGLLFAITLSLFNVANLHSDVASVVLLSHTSPFFVLLFAYFLLDEKITKTKIITLLGAVIGFLIMSPFEIQGNILGNFLAVLCAISLGLLVTFLRKEDQNHGIGDIFWFLLFAGLFLLPFAIYFGFGEINIYVILLGLVTGAAYLFYNLALKNIDAESASITVAVISSLVAIIASAIFLKDTISFKVILGGAILLLSIAYLELHNKKKKFTTPKIKAVIK